jgi:hypothetical protein
MDRRRRSWTGRAARPRHSRPRSLSPRSGLPGGLRLLARLARILLTCRSTAQANGRTQAETSRRAGPHPN